MSVKFDDVDVNHRWVTELRLPVIDSVHPNNNYFVTVGTGFDDDVNAISTLIYPDIVIPTDEEAAILASYLQYRIASYKYFQGFLNQMSVQLLDVDFSVATLCFLKLERGWVYRRSTWVTQVWPALDSDFRYDNIVDLLDKLERSFLDDSKVSEKWEAWKEEHNEVF